MENSVLNILKKHGMVGEQNFLSFHRKERNIVIRSLDLKATNLLQQTEKMLRLLSFVSTKPKNLS
jgi:hypothetical protein